MLFNNLFQYRSFNRSYSTKPDPAHLAAGPGSRLTNVERNSFNVPQHLHEVIIGSCLGDLIAVRKTIAHNTYFQFKQGLVNKDYIYHLFDLFLSFTNMEIPKDLEYLDKRSNKTYTSINFHTYRLPCFNYYYDLFYVDGIKRIPLNIGELLTPVSLAYWAMDDGSKKNNGFIFCTDSYTFEEVQLLINVLKQNFDLNCSIHKMTGKEQYRIYIKLDSMDKFISLVRPHFYESMIYKLGVNTD